MKRKGKILLTDIKADKNRAEAIKAYFENLSDAFITYSVNKLSLNYFTMKEMAEDKDPKEREEFFSYLDTIDAELKKVISPDGDVSYSKETDIDSILKVRDSITGKMKVLTAYTDAFQIYEYILNRKEAAFSEDKETVDCSDLAEKMYNFVFSDNDKVVINSKIQSLVAELPVRMTKQRFFDIISASLDIYKGSEKKSVDDFSETLRSAAGFVRPEGFDTLYPGLAAALNVLNDIDYKTINKENFDRLRSVIDEAAEIINENVTDFMMLQEIVNDTLILLYNIRPEMDKSLYPESVNASCRIIRGIAETDNIYQASEGFDEYFEKLMGAQEEAYEKLSFLVAGLYEITEGYMHDQSDDVYDKAKLLAKSDMLTSNSIFADIDDIDISPLKVVADTADADYIKSVKESLMAEFDKAFEGMAKPVKRSVMAKILSLVPVFFNTMDEIKDYFEYALTRCTDQDELMSCKLIIEDIMEG